MAGDGPIGGIVELRRLRCKVASAIALAVRSDLNLDQQCRRGRTWLDRRLSLRESAELSRAGFGAEVRRRLIGGSIPWRSRGWPDVMEIGLHSDATWSARYATGSSMRSDDVSPRKPAGASAC